MKHILIVDDNTTNLKMAASVLQPFYEVAMAKSGRQALTFLKKNTPDLILLDILMPEMDGYETMEEIKLNPQTANIPVIFLTADKERTSEMKGLSLGALDFITKPFDEASMLGRIEKVLMMDEMRRELFTEKGRSSDTGLVSFEVLREKAGKMIEDQKNGSLLILSFTNIIEIRENVDSKSFSAYMDYLYETLLFNNNENICASSVTDSEFAVLQMSSLCESEINEFASKCIANLSKSLRKTDGSNIMPIIKIGIEYIYGIDDFDTVFSHADKALYHARLTTGLNFDFYHRL